jgi:hypothetical protein
MKEKRTSPKLAEEQSDTLAKMPDREIDFSDDDEDAYSEYVEAVIAEDRVRLGLVWCDRCECYNHPTESGPWGSSPCWRVFHHSMAPERLLADETESEV